MRKAILFSGFVVSLLAQPIAAADVKIEFAGCVAPGVEHKCTIVKSGSNTFNISAAHPLPDYKKGLGISGSAIKTSKVSYCMQGAVLNDIKWNYTREKCPIPPVITPTGGIIPPPKPHRECPHPTGQSGACQNF